MHQQEVTGPSTWQLLGAHSESQNHILRCRDPRKYEIKIHTLWSPEDHKETRTELFISTDFSEKKRNRFPTWHHGNRQFYKELSGDQGKAQSCYIKTKAVCSSFTNMSTIISHWHYFIGLPHSGKYRKFLTRSQCLNTLVLTWHAVTGLYAHSRLASCHCQRPASRNYIARCGNTFEELFCISSKVLGMTQQTLGYHIWSIVYH